MSEFENEKIRGLPGPLPSGERILWRGSPDWRMLAWRAFHAREALVWFAVITTARIATSVASGAGFGEAVAQQRWIAPIAVLALALLCGLAWLSARTTVYTITDRRIVMRIGIALPLTFNLPHRLTGSAFLRLHKGGTGDLGVAFVDGTRLAWAVLWPHARPWRLRRPEPMLRAIPDAVRVADILSGALASTAGSNGFVRTNATTAAPEVLGPALPAGGVGAAT